MNLEPGVAFFHFVARSPQEDADMADPGRRQHFKMPDLKRLLDNLQKCGLRPGRIEVDRDGRTAVTPALDGDAPAATKEWEVATGAP
jgi:hypothetical protein